MNEGARSVTLTGKQLLEAIGLAALKIGGRSPLLALARTENLQTLDPHTRDALTDGGWWASGALTAAARAALQALCAPKLHARLIWGSRDTLAVIDAYAAHGWSDGELVSFVGDAEGNEYRIVPGLTLSQLTNAVTAQLLTGPLPPAPYLHIRTKPDEFVTLLAILDSHLQTLLASMLDRTVGRPARFTPASLQEILQVGRQAHDPSWMVTLLENLFPFLDYGLDEPRLRAAVAGLVASYLVSPVEGNHYTLAGQLLDLAGGLFPLSSFGALHLEQQEDSGPLDATYLAFVRGSAALLLAQPVTGEAGERLIAMDTVSGGEMADIVLGLTSAIPGPAAAPLEKAATPTQLKCPACGAEHAPGRKFCSVCGASLIRLGTEGALAAPVSVCPACARQVKPGSRFCPHCKTPLQTSQPGGVR